jgi:hypothetical protein
LSPPRNYLPDREIEVQTYTSAFDRLLREISWEGNARKYRHGGRGIENVITVEVFQALYFLPRAKFLARIFRSAIGGNPTTLEILAEQVEHLTFSLLPGDVDLAKDPPNGKRRLYLQPDGVLQSSTVYCMLEAKRIGPGKFNSEQLAREFLAVVQEKKRRDGLLLLVLPGPPPVRVARHGKLALHDAVARFLPDVLKQTEGFPDIDELCSIIDDTVAYTTWQTIEQEVEDSLRTFSCDDPSVQGSVCRLGKAVIDAIRWHGRRTSEYATP